MNRRTFRWVVSLATSVVGMALLLMSSGPLRADQSGVEPLPLPGQGEDGALLVAQEPTEADWAFLNTMGLPWKCGEWEPRYVSQDWNDGNHASSPGISLDLTYPGNEERGSLVLAPFSGNAVAETDYESLGEGKGYGEFVEITADNGWAVRLAHMERVAAGINGIHVSKGQVIGWAGDSGAEGQGVHIHLELEWRGSRPPDGWFAYSAHSMFSHPTWAFLDTPSNERNLYSNNCGEGPTTTLFEHAGFGGRSYHVFGRGTANLHDWFNDQASSITVANGHAATLYEHRAGQGGRIAFWASESDFADNTFDNTLGVNDKVSSILVDQVACVSSNAAVMAPSTAEGCDPPPPPPPPGPDPVDWLITFSKDQKPPLEVDIHVRVLGTSDFDAFRLCFDGQNCQETSATELFYTWNTHGWADGYHTLRIEYRRKLDGGNWANALRYEEQYYLSPERNGIAPCDGGDGAYLRADGDCIRLTASIADLMPIHWDKRPDLSVSVLGQYEAWVYDGSNFTGVAQVVRSGEQQNVGGNVSSVELRAAPGAPPPLPTAPFTCDAMTRHLYHLDEGGGNTVSDTCGSAHGTLDGGAGWVNGQFSRALYFPNPPDGYGVRTAALDVCPMTVEAWVRRPADSGGGRIAGQLSGRGNTGQNKWLLSLNGSHLVFEHWSAGGSRQITSNVDISDQNWHYVMASYDCNRTVKLYLDNVLVEDLTTDAVWPSGATTFEIGAAEGIYRCNCDIDEVRLSNGVRVPEWPAPPQANFSASPLEGIAPLPVIFSDQSTGVITSWLWDFGDGTTSTDRNPLHYFNAPGEYTVTLTVSGPGGAHDLTRQNLVSVLEPPPPNAPGSFHVSDATQGSITLTWQDNSTDELGFTIYRWDGSILEFVAWGSVPANATSFTDTRVDCASGYAYQVTAFNHVGESEPAPWITGVTDACSPPEYAGQVVDDDNNGESQGNGDGIANSGETVELTVRLRNPGGGTIPWVNATLVTSDPYVTRLQNTGSSYPDIQAGAVAENDDDWELSIAANTPVGHAVTLCLNPITARDSGPWEVCFEVAVSAPPSTAQPVFVSSTSDGTIAGISFADEDILKFDMSTSAWSFYFDGSDVGVTQDLTAFDVLADGSILMVFDRDQNTTAGRFTPWDVARFRPTSTGSSTAGNFEWYLKGSRVFLTASGEKIDAIDLALDGRLLISTLGTTSVQNASGASFKVNDEDLIAYTGTWGTNSVGTWSFYFDGSDVGLTASSENVGGVSLNGNGDIFLSTQGAFSVPGLNGTSEDIFIFHPSTLGSLTDGTFGPGLFWDGSAVGFAGEVVDGFNIGPQ